MSVTICKREVATGARAFVAYQAERCFGVEDVVPAVGRWKQVTITSESVVREATILESAALNPERARRTRTQGSSSVGGDLNVEFANDSYLFLVAGAIGRIVMPKKLQFASDSDTPTSVASAWSDYNFGSDDYGSAHYNCPITILPVDSGGVGWNENFVGIQVNPSDVVDSAAWGSYNSATTGSSNVLCSNFYIHYDTANSDSPGYENGYYEVAAYGMEPGFTFVIGRDSGLIDDSAGNDPTNELFFKYEGMKVNTWSLTLSPTEIATGTFSMLGRSESIVDEARPTTTAGSNDPFTGFSGNFIVDDSDHSGTVFTDEFLCVLSFDMTLNNNLGTDQYCLGERFRNSLPEGQRQIEGTFTSEFKDLRLYQKFVDGSAARIEIILDLNEDGVGTSANIGTESIRIILPKVEFNGTTPVNAGNEAINQEIPYTALWDDAGNAQLIRSAENLAPTGFDIAVEASTTHLFNKTTKEWA